MLLPFYSTHATLQLSGPERDRADKIFKAARKDACAAASGVISLGAAMKETLSSEMPVIAAKVRAILPSEAPNRVHKSYSWLMFVTLKVNDKILHLVALYPALFPVSGYKATIQCTLITVDD